jgi:hypothetical protein
VHRVADSSLTLGMTGAPAPARRDELTAEEQLQYALDRIAIRDLLCTYARGMDRRDPALIASICTPDARFKSRGAEYNSREEFLNSMRPERISIYKSSMHFVGNQLVEIDGDRASAETYVIAHWRYDQDGVEQEYVMGTRYEDQLVRQGGRWLIEDRLMHHDWFRGRSPLHPERQG